ncbi:MAG TPA: hypothetical protein PLZ95_18575 [Bryobacteraceae bacterium]|nr:hypothetical protein [Bryobacteraceae bacterium]
MTPQPNELKPKEDEPKPVGTSGYAKAGAYMGLATITPISGYICYLIGGWVDRGMGWNWAATAGLLVGCVAGIYETFRQAVRIEGLDKRK